MKKTRKIGFSATLAIAYVISVVGVTQLHSINADILTNEALANYQRNQKINASSSVVTVQEVSRKVIGQLYGTDIATAKVLGDNTTALATLSQEQISDISNPAIVRVFNYITGSITIPEFNIDLNTLNLVALEQTYTEQIEELATGTGFFVDDNGHILTNAHVIDERMALDNFSVKVVEYYAATIFSSLFAMSPEQQEELENSFKQRYGGNDQDAAERLADDMLKFINDFLDANAVTNLTQTITILDPSKTSGTINSRGDLVNLVLDSFPATIISLPQDYKQTQKDVSLLKIDSKYTPTPSLQLNESATVSVGQKIYVLGFPSNATVDRSDVYSTTLTTGTINSIKEVQGIKVYQTDAKISPGSSGGPALNENGQVVGMMTFLTSGLVGDSFAFAIPIQFGQELLTNNNVSNREASFANNFLHGIQLKSDKMCRQANEKFSAINNMNALFAQKIELQKYIDECNTLIASGQSMDGTWENLKSTLAKVPPYAWAGGAAITAIIIAAIYFIRRHRLTEVDDIVVPTSTISTNSV